MKRLILFFAHFCIILLLTGCRNYVEEKKFLSKHELDDYSDFFEVNMIYRGVTKNNDLCVFGWYKSHIKTESLKDISYIMTIDSMSYCVNDIEFMRVNSYTKEDSVRLAQLSKKFLSYKIARIEMDENGNLYVYLKNFEKYSLVKFANDIEFKKNRKSNGWKKIADSWYVPLR